MADFDLSQALDASPDEKPLHSCCSVTANTEDASLPYDMKLVISCNHKTMQRVVNLVVAINKLKKLALTKSKELSDKQQCNSVFEALIEERSTAMLESNGKTRVYERVDSFNQCTLCDIAQKDVIHASGELKLHAITLKGGNYKKKVKFQLSRYIFPEESAAKGQPVILSITNSNLHLSCSMQDVKAVLNLEQCMVSKLQNISSENNMDRFLFYKTITGESMTMFESVRCPGWYISTSSAEEDQPVEMCQADSAATRLTNFLQH